MEKEGKYQPAVEIRKKVTKQGWKKEMRYYIIKAVVNSDLGKKGFYGISVI
ncbi:MAG: hypothetical protein J5986_11155 [Roseburia sp.]|nr:hypothetical protein [Roseburia sp.]